MLSYDLIQQLSQFFSELLKGELNEPEALARALDELSDLAWTEAEEILKEELPDLKPNKS